MHISTFFSHTKNVVCSSRQKPDGRWFRINVFVYFEYLNYDNKMLTLVEALQCEVVLLDKKTRVFTVFLLFTRLCY